MQLVPSPTNLKGVQSVLGLFNYYRNFVPDFAKITAPLYKLIKKNEPFKWTEDQQQALDTLKQKMVEAPILAHPDFDKPFILYSDASYFGFGYILSQEKDGVEHPVGYGSRKISPAENNYTITELECSAVVWSVRENKQFLGINPFTLVTDHKALATIQTQELPQERRRIRWILELNQYNYIIKYRQGKKMAHVDFFSRNPVSYTAQNQQDEQYFQPTITVVEGPQTPWHTQPLTNQV